MITDYEWNEIAKKAFPARSVKAPPFLWTRILARIEAEEARQASTWWLQWRWMSRVTLMVGLVVSLGAFYLFQHAALPLEIALDGRSNQHQALKIASANVSSTDESAVLLLGLDS